MRAASAAAAAPAALHEHVVWDWPVRIVHWALALALPAAYITHQSGVAYFAYHAWCGYAVLVLVVFRIVWGIVGTHHARFANFVRGLGTTLVYVRDWMSAGAPHPVGHNPLGAWMVLLLLTALLLQAVSGMFATDDILNTGPLSGYVDGEWAARLTSLHRRFFYWIVAAALMHIAAVFYHLLVKKDDLIRAMLTGRKFSLQLPARQAAPVRHLWRAALVLGAVAATLAIVITTAPVPTIASYE